MMRTDFWWYSSVASFWISSSILSTSLIKSRRKEKNSGCVCLYACASQTIHTVYTSYTQIAVTCIKTGLSVLIVQFSGLKTLERMWLQKLLPIAMLHVSWSPRSFKAKFICAIEFRLVRCNKCSSFLPGSPFRPRMISLRLSCIEILSSHIIRANITRDTNWLV